MIILALDISSVSTGFAVLTDDAPIPDAYGTICPDHKKSEGARLLYFEQEVVKLIDTYKPTEVICEDIFYSRNVVSFKILAEYRGVALKTIYEHTGKEASSVMAVEARRVVGVGCKKDEAFEGIIEKYGLEHYKFEFQKHNDILDAFCLSYALRDLLSGKATLTAKPKRTKKRHKKATKRKTRKTKKK